MTATRAAQGPASGGRRLRARRPASAPSVRRATAADVPAIAELLRQVDDVHARILPGYFRRPHGDAAASARLQRTLPAPGDSGTKIILVAVRAGVIGFVLVQIYDTPDEPDMKPARRAHVEDLVVDRAHRRAGAGTALMKAAAEWARAAGADDLILTVWQGNQAAERFYESLGYRPLSRVLHKDL